MQDDATLLRLHSEDPDCGAFDELVKRHLPLVFNSALRRLGGDAHAAEDVSQRVFLSLSQNAARLSAHTALAAWLFTATRNASLDHLRSERRRRERELVAVGLHINEAPSVGAFSKEMKTELDTALDKLAEAERSVLLLRFFRGCSYTEISGELGISMDAARMRSERALEKLRTQLAKAGIHSSAALLASTLAAQASTSLPSTLLAQVIEVGSITSTPAAFLGSNTASSALLMSSSKILATAAVLSSLSIGMLIWQYRRASAADARASRLEMQLTKQEEELNALRRLSPGKTSQSISPQQEIATYLKTNNKAIDDGLAKVTALKDLLRCMPQLGIPELALCSDADWLKAVEGPLESVTDYRRALSRLRQTATDLFASALKQGLDAYLKEHSDQFPDTPAAILVYSDKALTAEMCARYQIVPRAEMPYMNMGGENIITQKSLIDPELDKTEVIGTSGLGSTSMSTSDSKDLLLAQSAFDAYKKACGNSAPVSIEDVLRFASTEEQRSALKRLSAKSKNVAQ